HPSKASNSRIAAFGRRRAAARTRGVFCIRTVYPTKQQIKCRAGALHCRAAVLREKRQGMRLDHAFHGKSVFSSETLFAFLPGRLAVEARRPCSQCGRTRAVAKRGPTVAAGFGGDAQRPIGSGGPAVSLERLGRAATRSRAMWVQIKCSTQFTNGSHRSVGID